MGNPFVHVELETNDVAKAKGFYSKLFDWKLEDVPNPAAGGSYTMISVGDGTGGGMMKIVLALLCPGRRHRSVDQKSEVARRHGDEGCDRGDGHGLAVDHRRPDRRRAGAVEGEAASEVGVLPAG
jgi:catechol 2,3-dioxygenase-like lactoylglutathione lyase family enzyme